MSAWKKKRGSVTRDGGIEGRAVLATSTLSSCRRQPLDGRETGNGKKKLEENVLAAEAGDGSGGHWQRGAEEREVQRAAGRRTAEGFPYRATFQRPNPSQHFSHFKEQ